MKHRSLLVITGFSAACALVALALSIRAASRRSFRTGMAMWAEDAESATATAGSFVTEETYKLTFPDGRPVKVGELQRWLDEIRADPDIPDSEFVIAVEIVQKIRARLN